MKKNKLSFIFCLILIVCCGCTNKYTLTYEDDKFSEELIISDLTMEDKKALIKYVEGSKYLVIDDKNSYHYEENDNSKIYTNNMGHDFIVSPLINTCFEDVFVLDEEDYIHLKTSGDFYCENYEVEVYFKTDKKVIYSNSDSVKDNVYKWNSLEKGIELQFSKDKNFVQQDNVIDENVSNILIRLIICLVFIGLITFVYFYLKKKNSE